MDTRLMRITRFPVKSLVGQDLSQARIDHRGLAGDRQWAVRDPDGKFGSGKNTRRFRRMDGLLDLVAHHDHDGIPIIRFPDGRRLRADHADVHAALSAHVGREVTLAPEGDVSHFDEGPLHLVTTAALTRLEQLVGGPVDVRHMRANLVVDTGASVCFDEAEWIGRDVMVGDEVVLRPVSVMTRCVMLDLAQHGLPAHGRLLKTVTAANDAALGLVVEVGRPGTVRLGDAIVR